MKGVTLELTEPEVAPPSQREEGEKQLDKVRSTMLVPFQAELKKCTHPARRMAQPHGMPPHHGGFPAQRVKAMTTSHLHRSPNLSAKPLRPEHHCPHSHQPNREQRRMLPLVPLWVRALLRQAWSASCLFLNASAWK